MRARNYLLAVLMCASFGATAKDKAFRVPRLSDGHPDMQGMWTLSNLTQLERPPGIDSLVITAADVAKIKKEFENVIYDPSKPADPPDFDDDRQVEPLHGELRSSLIIDPPDGKLPVTALFRERSSSTAKLRPANAGPEDRRSGERCITGAPATAPMMSLPNSNLHQIVQTPSTIVIVSEFNHEARIVKMNATHVPANIVSWLGDSTGRWDGDTLVVETKYFTPNDPLRKGPIFEFFISPRAVVVERFTMISDNELSYVFYVDDPVYYTRPWTGENHFLRTHELMYEYACHEGNYSLEGILRGARAQDATDDKR